ncbi:hypothetical protein BFG60_5047 [Microcystis aeruginosa NIES-98]|nr:hypothetical protein BFG60_5047 [Microcystis aeruginosa NIES-98]
MTENSHLITDDWVLDKKSLLKEERFQKSTNNNGGRQFL